MVQPANLRGRESGSGMKGEVESSILSGSTTHSPAFNLANLGVEGSKPFARSEIRICFQAVQEGRASGLRGCIVGVPPGFQGYVEVLPRREQRATPLATTSHSRMNRGPGKECHLDQGRPARVVSSNARTPV